MKEYLEKIKTYSKILTKCSKWENTNSSLFSTIHASEKDKDYVYELFCYFIILKDLTSNYELEYNKGNGAKENVFPKAPANKDGFPFFYVLDKAKNKLFQVCAGTGVQAITNNLRYPDISFQNGEASLTAPRFSEIQMIFDAKRKRATSKSSKLSINQYSYFTTMVLELQQQNAAATTLLFDQFTSFIGNCLITNREAYCRDLTRNNFHKIKEIENFDDLADLTKVFIIG